MKKQYRVTFETATENIFTTTVIVDSFQEIIPTLNVIYATASAEDKPILILKAELQGR